MLRLNSRGKTVKQIAVYLECADSTVRQTIYRWQSKGLAGLWEAPGRGKKATWTEEDWSAVEKWLSEDHTYSARQLSQRLASEKLIKLGSEQVRRILVKKMALEKIKKQTTFIAKRRIQERQKNDLKMLRLGQQKSIPQNKNRGRRINIMGVWEEDDVLNMLSK